MLTGHPRFLSLERLACKVDPWLASGNSDFGGIPPILSLRRAAPFPNGTSRVYAKDLLSFMSLDFWCVL